MQLMQFMESFTQFMQLIVWGFAFQNQDTKKSRFLILNFSSIQVSSFWMVTVFLQKKIAKL